MDKLTPNLTPFGYPPTEPLLHYLNSLPVRDHVYIISQPMLMFLASKEVQSNGLFSEYLLLVMEGRRVGNWGKKK